MWRSLNSVIGSKKDGGSLFQVQDGKRLLSEPKDVATKFNKVFATIGSKIAGKLCRVSRDAWQKYEPKKQTDSRDSWDLQRVGRKTVLQILHSMKARL